MTTVAQDENQDCPGGPGLDPSMRLDTWDEPADLTPMTRAALGPDQPALHRGRARCPHARRARYQRCDLEVLAFSQDTMFRDRCNVVR